MTEFSASYVDVIPRGYAIFDFSDENFQKNVVALK